MVEILSLDVDGYEFMVDDKPMWDFLGAARRRTPDVGKQKDFVRVCILRMLEAGAIPYEVREGLPFGRDFGRWRGLEHQEIADGIVEATFAAPDIFEANIWWQQSETWGETTSS